MENPLRKHPLGKGKGNWETPGLGVKGVFNKWRGGGTDGRRITCNLRHGIDLSFGNVGSIKSGSM